MSRARRCSASSSRRNSGSNSSPRSRCSAIPVAFSIDNLGRCFVSETYRYRSSVLDIRHYMFMLEDDMANRTVADREAQIRKNFPNEWQKLGIETEVVRLVEDRDGDGVADFSSGLRRRLHDDDRRHRLRRARARRQGLVHEHPEPLAARWAGRGRQGEEARIAEHGLRRALQLHRPRHARAHPRPGWTALFFLRRPRRARDDEGRQDARVSR